MNPRLSLFSVISSLWHKFKKRRKIQVIGALCLILISGLFEMISLGLVVPFLTVLIDPKLLFENSFTASIVNFFKLDQISNLRLIFTISLSNSCIRVITAEPIFPAPKTAIENVLFCIFSKDKCYLN